MKTLIASLIALLLAWAVVPASAQNWSYNNGPINGNTDAWTINFGYVVSDSFVAGGNSVNGFQFGVWEYPGDVVTSVQWAISSGENQGTLFGSGTASGKDVTDQFISFNYYGYDIDNITVTGLNVAVTSGTLYWLTLQNATVPSGDPVFWDENSGIGCTSGGCPSMASNNSEGTLPSEAFTISGGGSGTTPEPGSFLLLASGALGLAGILRRKLR